MFITTNVKDLQSYNKQFRLTKYFKDNSSADGNLTRNWCDNCMMKLCGKLASSPQFFPWLIKIPAVF